MSFITNILEDCENFLIEVINEEKLLQVRKETEKLSIVKSSLKQRQADILVLFQEGFNYNKIKDEFYKTENINYGRYPGKYKITISFPIDYPQSHPNIRFKPLHIGKISEHISRTGNICLSNTEHGHPWTFWKPNMNVIGALRQAYHLVTDEIHKRDETRKKIPIEGTIFSSISKIIDTKTFVKEFAEPHKLIVDWTYAWEEIAYTVSQTKISTKNDLVTYYNKIKRRK